MYIGSALRCGIYIRWFLIIIANFRESFFMRATSCLQLSIRDIYSLFWELKYSRYKQPLDIYQQKVALFSKRYHKIQCAYDIIYYVIYEHNNVSRRCFATLYLKVMSYSLLREILLRLLILKLIALNIYDSFMYDTTH